MSSDERSTRGIQGEKQANPRVRVARGEGDAGGPQEHKGAPHGAQRYAMPMTGIEPYRSPQPTIREVMEGRPVGANDCGVPPKGYLGRPPKSAYRTVDRAEAEKRAGAREIQPWCAEQRRAHGAGEQQ